MHTCRRVLPPFFHEKTYPMDLLERRGGRIDSGQVQLTHTVPIVVLQRACRSRVTYQCGGQHMRGAPHKRKLGAYPHTRASC